MSLVLDGVDQYAVLDTGTISASQDFSFFAYVKTTPAAVESFIYNLCGSTAFRTIGLIRDDSEHPGGRYFPNNDSYRVYDTEELGASYRKILTTWDSSTYTVTIQTDDNTQLSFTDSSSATAIVQRLMVGARFGGSSYTSPQDFFVGSVSHAAVWYGTKLTGSDLSDLMDGTLKPDELSVAPSHYRPFVGDQSGGIGANFTLINSPTINSEDPYSATGPAITNIDGDNDVYPTQSAVITGTTFGATQGSGGVTLGGVAQTVTAWSDTSITITVTQSGLKYDDHDLIATDALAASSTALSTTLSPESGLTFIDVASPVSDSTSLFFGASPAVATGDQLEHPTTTDQGKTLTVAADGTFVITDAGNTLQTFSIRVWDETDSTWSSMAVAVINGEVLSSDMVSSMVSEMVSNMIEEM